MRRPVILAGSPRIEDLFGKDTGRLFDEAGGNTGNLAFRRRTLHRAYAQVLQDAQIDTVDAFADFAQLA